MGSGNNVKSYGAICNPTYRTLTVTKKIVIALEENQSYLPPIWLGTVWLNSDQAFRIDSWEIWNALPASQRSLYAVTKGYVGIISLSPYLDVNAYYTVSELKISGMGPIPTLVAGNTTSIDSQIISPKPYEHVIDLSFTSPP